MKTFCFGVVLTLFTILNVYYLRDRPFLHAEDLNIYLHVLENNKINKTLIDRESGDVIILFSVNGDPQALSHKLKASGLRPLQFVGMLGAGLHTEANLAKAEKNIKSHENSKLSTYIGKIQADLPPMANIAGTEEQIHFHDSTEPKPLQLAGNHKVDLHSVTFKSNKVKQMKGFNYNISRPGVSRIHLERPEPMKTYPVTIGDSPYKIENRNICQGIEKLLFLVLVHTAIPHVQRRNSIRETWANYSLLKNQNMRIVFLVGHASKPKMQSQIEHENALHRDIVQGKFKDTYHNLTHKGVLGLRWVSENCRQAYLVIKVDDDVFVNVLQLTDDILNKYQNISRKLMGFVRWKGTAPVMRYGKWKVDDNEFVNITHYPFAHCKGFFVIITADLVTELYAAAKTTPFFWIDDIYLFGILPDKVVNVTFVPLDNLNLNQETAIRCFNSTEIQCPLLVANAHSDGVMVNLWHTALKQNKKLALKYLKL